MDLDRLSPAQHEVLEHLLAVGQPRPSFHPSLRDRLRADVEAALTPVVAGLDPGALPWITKRALASIHACEVHHLADVDGGFPGWTAATARGTVVHKAIELSVAMAGRQAPLALVDHALATLAAADTPAGLGRWLRAADPLAVAELRAGANEAVAGFLECWPPLARSWSPRTETAIGAMLCGNRVVLRARVDLVLGTPRGNEARSLVVDLKTGRPQPHHADDLRFYALVQTLRLGTPPFRVASYYLDTASHHAEDVTEELLGSAARRVADGVTKMVELQRGTRAPALVPGPRCEWCPVRGSCDGARTWRELGAVEFEGAGV